jgi:chaperonin cofactor prefoldin
VWDATAKIESQSEDLAEQERVKRDLHAQLDDHDFRLSEMEKQLDIAAAKYKDLEVELASLLQVPSPESIHAICVYA